MLERVYPCQSLDELLQNCPKDQIIGDNLIRAWSKINNEKYKKIVCSISGGSDSDIALDICRRCDREEKITYVWFDTGLEYQATKDHLKYLEEKYGIKIQNYKAIKPIPTCCKEYGQPFLSKQVSEFMMRLQNHGFHWEDEPFDVLLRRYCKWDEKKQDWIGCKSALMWWCCENQSILNITRNKYLKEFLMEYHPDFKISNKCCYYAKKETASKVDRGIDLKITGIRRTEGGARATAYKSCFSDGGEYDNYRPVFWYKKKEKRLFAEHYGVKHSKCYTEYGLSRTGCAGCPYGKDFEFELQVINEHEPKLFKAVNNIFGESYEYTRKYREFVKMMDKMKNEQENGRQMEIFDYL